jgi:hypothetical protein
MSTIFAAILLIIGVVGGAIVAIAAPLLVGVMIFEMVRSEESKPVEVERTPARIAVKRGIARGFVVGGGVFWSFASFAGLYSFHRTGLGAAFLAAFYPLAACAVTLVVGWYYERVTAGMLVLAALGVFVWGVIYEFEMGVWVLMTLALIGPILTAAVLFWLARRDQEAYEHAFAFAPELSLVFSARSTLAPAPAN